MVIPSKENKCLDIFERTEYQEYWQANAEEKAWLETTEVIKNKYTKWKENFQGQEVYYTLVTHNPDKSLVERPEEHKKLNLAAGDARHDQACYTRLLPSLPISIEKVDEYERYATLCFCDAI